MSKHQIAYTVFGAFTLFYVYGYIVNGWSLFYYISFFVFWFFLILYGSFFIGSNYHLKAVSSVKTKEKVVAITFDDGPTEYTKKVLELLKIQGHKATFFCVGNRIEKSPDVMKMIIDDGHLIGNHTYSHAKSNGFKSTKSIVVELTKADQIIKKYTGAYPKYFRPPFGVTNPNIMRAIRKTNHTVVGWSIRSLDTVMEDEEKIFSRVKRQVKSGSIILLHDTSEKSIHVLERLLIYMNENDYRSLTVDELLKLK
jgi:peptidoglycan/xylan/chitin deacetylase (PgdA/CDA1 family)